MWYWEKKFIIIIIRYVKVFVWCCYVFFVVVGDVDMVYEFLRVLVGFLFGDFGWFYDVFFVKYYYYWLCGWDGVEDKGLGKEEDGVWFVWWWGCWVGVWEGVGG